MGRFRLIRRKKLNKKEDDTFEDVDLKDEKNGKQQGKKGKQRDDNVNDDQTEATVEDDMGELLQEVIRDNLDLMYEIVMKVRDDENFARTVYADCPRLQHLLDKYPDLRPVFEDPNLVRINFEEVYKKAGGVLPENRPNMFIRILSCIVNHPLFKVFRFLLLVKKCYGFFMGGGLMLIKGILCGCFTPDIPVPNPEDLLEDADEMISSPENLANREALNKVADNMEDPEVRDNLRRLIESDPDSLDEAIENDPDLQALRESSAMCAELMNDPETMRILVDPDNLRALADCPDLIEADFENPNWLPPDVESVPFDDPDYAAEMEGQNMNADVEGDAEQEGEADNDGEAEDEDEEEEFLDEIERGEQTQGANKGKQNNKKQQNKKDKGNGGGGFLSTIGTGLVDYIAAETVGVTASEMFGGDDGLGGLEDQADEAADEAAEAAEEAESNMSNIANVASAAADLAENDDLAENLEDTMDNVEETHESKADQHTSASSSNLDVAEDVATAGVIATYAVPGQENKRKSLTESVKEEEEEEEPKKRGIFRGFGKAIGGGLSALSTATKEFAVGAILGEDLAEELVEKIEESDDEEDEKDGNEKENEKKDTKETKKSSKGSLFRRRN